MDVDQEELLKTVLEQLKILTQIIDDRQSEIIDQNNSMLAKLDDVNRNLSDVFTVLDQS